MKTWQMPWDAATARPSSLPPYPMDTLPGSRCLGGVPDVDTRPPLHSGCSHNLPWGELSPGPSAPWVSVSNGPSSRAAQGRDPGRLRQAHLALHSPPRQPPPHLCPHPGQSWALLPEPPLSAPTRALASPGPPSPGSSLGVEPEPSPPASEPVMP